MWVLWRLEFSKRKIKEKASLGDGMVKISMEVQKLKEKKIKRSLKKRDLEKKKKTQCWMKQKDRDSARDGDSPLKIEHVKLMQKCL